MAPRKTNEVDFPQKQETGLPPWGESYARELLLDDLKQGLVPKTHQPLIMSTREIFSTRQEYKLYGYKNFYSRLSALREQLGTCDSQADKDKKAFQIYICNYPPDDLCCRGYPHWEGSNAQRQLKADIDNGEHEKLTPYALWADENRSEYRQFPQEVFRWHLYQEIRTRKYHNYLNVKEEYEKTKRQKRHEKALVKIETRKQKQREKEHMDGLILYSCLRKKLHLLDLEAELVHRGVAEDEVSQLRTFTNLKNRLKCLEQGRVKDEQLEHVRKAATKAFRSLSEAPFNIDS